ncbi:gfo/Idh/MocA family oxidoreductase [Pradoshia eiseniae]|uniref:Gfo/Idh/MocA family oxidoreductase n=1 Tax=Pradoshia eiseniae TaxID=2064768 RepID=A0A2S7N1V4_9BACI|nr:Gfo/Idh/MocA family oxidoreductase [Pradoshia eiseniae]PQD95999.1 gfo/Idh/MocA family oxidoreductase [Pradoshia eiseniae]
MRENLNWAVLGTGVVANEMAASLKKAGKTFYAVGNRTHSKAIDFAEKHGIGKVYDDFHEMFHDENVDIIYITTPHNTHIEFMREALKNGKHLLVEKSITLNSDELDEAIRIADEKQVVLAEAMTIFHMPIYKKLKALIDSGAMGELRMIQMNFGSYKEYDMENRFFNKNLAGGALLDIGVYAISFARWFMSEKPNQVVSQVKYAPTGVDEQAGILMMNEKQEMVTIALTLHSKQPKRGMISCDKGYIELMEYPRGQKAVITYTETGEQEVIEEGRTEDALYYEMLDMEAAVKGNKEVTHLNLTKDVMDIMTEIRREWGLIYPEEEGK